ncbi:glycosyltransferase family 4 protein [Luteolibacter flavescens]|uniref:Glycosyltransferase family 4 protein n=1 Tax=Luteolibacter flavescens TaxID=1859460 RepID=A0ABT3FNN0_9BACT|nr:glycosyltransferase family 4 protein [Luteolibacter flavescens]MCW1885170.1 glycosyltransferase family 4 protein [Luteolibacter flavescens]
MKVATCTPVDFAADEHFFGRDSGLMCRGFQEIGVSCVSVMPGARRADDPADQVRVTMDELSDAGWWRLLEVELVLLYAWGDPRFMKVATAIRDAGIKLVQSLDTAGLTTPYGDTREWWLSFAAMLGMPQPPGSRVKMIGKAGRDFIPAAFEKSRLKMINTSDKVASVSPPAAASVRRYAESLGFPEVSDKVIVVPHPVSPLMKSDGRPKERKIIVVGRWTSIDTGQKDPEMLMQVLGDFLPQRPEWRVEIIGRDSETLAGRCDGWSEDARSRVSFLAPMSRAKLAEHYATSRIIFCPSRFESFHISSGEALCCGCAVVVADHPLLASTGWFTTEQSGTLAPERTRGALTAALEAETDQWEKGARDPDAIAGTWSRRLYAGSVVRSLLEQMQMTGKSNLLSA